MIIAIQTLIFFRESLFAAIDRLLQPYYKHFSLTFNRHASRSDDEESEDHVFAEFDDEKGVVFFPPVYAQRYAAVTDCLMDERWCGKLEKVVDLGYNDMSFIKYLKDVPGIKSILGVDIESIPLRFSSDMLGNDYIPKRETPLQVTLYQGNAADPDYRLIGCDAVISIEMIEHMLPHDLERLVHTIFGFIKPWIAVITTPNGDFNPLFKAMESNGLRRLDHFFEWSREQFHDWCSNIVARYPQYTVSCRGIGPGPAGTGHYGCCSQLALFVSKDYHKQEDLNLNSLSLVAKAPKPANVCDIIGNFDSPTTLTENNMICSPNDIESYTDLVFSDKQSCITLILSPTFSLESLEYRDKTAQCNLDSEVGKNFLMFDEEPSFDVLVPRRKIDNRVYVIEDVNSRLNCTTLHVKKFSKTTQNMLAKNKIDSIAHTRGVVHDIKQLTRMLNFEKDTKERLEGNYAWYNINWGDNAPYWNQYYKIVREYSYPYEVKSEESRILDLISDEINRLIDMQYDDEMSDASKIEIPVNDLMRVVQHITDDVDRVRDILEWNGYEIVADVLIYSRLVVDNVSVASQEEDWRDDAFSDWDTDVHSTSISDGSTIMPDYHGRRLHRALDRKVRKLRSMLSADEDITVELDRVVCRLMKLALSTCRSRQRPPSMKWLQCKMLDLLTLTEKAIDKKKHFVGTRPLKAICYEDQNAKPVELNLTKIKEDDNTANEIVRKYRHLVRSSDNNTTAEDQNQYQFYDDLSHKSSKEYLQQTVSSELNFEDILRSPSLVDIEPTPKYPISTRKVYYKNDTPLARTQAWVEEDVNIVRYPKQSVKGVSSGDTDHGTKNIARKKNQRKYKLPTDENYAELDVRRRKKSTSKTPYDKYKAKNAEKLKNKVKTSKTRLTKKAVKNKSSYNILVKTSSKKISSASFVKAAVRSRKSLIRNITRDSASKPIPEVLKNLCHLENIKKETTDTTAYKYDASLDGDSISEVHIESDIARTEESLLIDIVTDEKQETIALRRTIGTDAEDDVDLLEQETVLGSLTNVMKSDSFYNKFEAENVHSQTIFIYDINEPSTSKGVRHVSMDVQCGPDFTNTNATLSATTSFTRLPKIFNTGIKIGDSSPNLQIQKKSAEFGTSTIEGTNNSVKTLTPTTKSVGIRIKNSDTVVNNTVENGTMTQEYIKHEENNIAHAVLSLPNSLHSATTTQLIKPVSSRLKMEDSGSEFGESIAGYRKSTYQFSNLSKDTSEFQIKSSVSKDVGVERKLTSKYVRPKLCCGGVHVHSYKDRQTSEDVVYQGEWQRYRPKPLSRRKANVVVPKRKNEITNKKTKNVSKENVIVNRDVKSPCKRSPARTVTFKQLPEEEPEKPTVDPVKNIATCKTAPKNKCNRIDIKVAKKIVTSSILSKPNKVSYVTKKPSITSCMKKEMEKPQRCCRKNYLPLYLKRKLASKLKNESLIRQTNSTRTVIETSKERPIGPLNEAIEPKVNAKDDLLESLDIRFEPRENVSYVVFHNETDKIPIAECEVSSPFRINITERDSDRRSPSPNSQDSSAYSSPNSIATVRAKTNSKLTTDRRYSTSSNKSSFSNSERENTPIKNKKFTKRAKGVKKPHDKDLLDNKENVPESNKRSREAGNITKSSFMRNKNIYRAHISSECTPQTAHNSLSRHRPQTATKSNVRIPTVPCCSGKYSAASSRPSVSKKSSPISSSLQSLEESGIILVHSELPSVASLRHDVSQNLQHESNEGVIINIVDNTLLSEWMNSSYKNIVDSHTSNILAAMRTLVEERLDFIDRSSDKLEVDSKTVVLSRDESVSVSATTSFYDSSSLNNSYDTVIAREENGEYADINDIQKIVNNTLDSILGTDSYASLPEPEITETDLDLLSFKSLASTSKISEYFLAESSLNDIRTPRHSGPRIPNSGSVRDIYERKKQLSVQNITGASAARAVQAFSGFSMNVEPVAGDQPDIVNIVDSETGSFGVEYNRQTTSEELFISGRSSSSYESCLVDEDAVVPYWLFQIISQQQSVDDDDDDEAEDQEPLLPMQAPLAEPLYDINGNVMEPGMGPGAGAGDGRGIHSDNSQDSSGRGTSLSSSATSSGPQSDVIPMDPTAFTAQYSLTNEPVSSSVLVPTIPLDSPDTSFMTADGAESSCANDLNSSGERCERPAISLTAASDVDADVSSIDTDAPDSSDN